MKMSRLFSICLSVINLATVNSYAIGIGNKFPIAVASHQQQANGIAYDGSNYIVALQGDGVSKQNLAAQRISPTGALLGALISTGRTGGAPLIAFDGTNYMMAWTDNADPANENIYGCIISTAGVRGVPFPISQVTGNQQLTGLAFDGNNYLAVWEDYRGFNQGSDVYGQFMSPSGVLVGAEIPICIKPHFQLGSALAFDGTNYFVCWMNQRYDDNYYDVYGCFVSKSGITTEPFQISATTSPRYNPIGVAYGKNGYMVTWNKDVSAGLGSPSLWDVYGRVVSPSGSLISSELAISTAAGSQVMPLVASDGNRYLVAWTDANSIDTSIWGRIYTDTGSADGEAFPIVEGAGTRLLYPLIYGGGRYFMGLNENITVPAWREADVYGLFLYPSGASTTTLQVSIDPGAGYLGSKTGVKLNYSLVGSKSYSGPLALNNSGKALLDGVDPGIYTLSLSGSHWLKRVVSGVNVNGTNGVNTTLTNGDADGGNSINLFDFVVLDSKFGSADAMADLTGDGAVNLFDYVIIDQNFGAMGD